MKRAHESIDTDVQLPEELWITILQQCELSVILLLISHSWSRLLDRYGHPSVQEWGSFFNNTFHCGWVSGCDTMAMIKTRLWLQDKFTSVLVALLNTYWPKRHIPMWLFFMHKRFQRYENTHIEINEVRAHHLYCVLRDGPQYQLLEFNQFRSHFFRQSGRRIQINTRAVYLTDTQGRGLSSSNVYDVTTSGLRWKSCIIETGDNHDIQKRVFLASAHPPQVVCAQLNQLHIDFTKVKNYLIDLSKEEAPHFRTTAAVNIKPVCDAVQCLERGAITG
jgi:hypothetical protein